MHAAGKIEVKGKVPIKTRDDLSMAYTPGVARVLMAIRRDPAKAWALPIKANTVTIISDGTAVLGLGDIGPAAAMPMTEGKAMLFEEFAGVDPFPLCIDTKDLDEIVAFVKSAAPAFGGINLEDIAAPRRFEIERRLVPSSIFRSSTTTSTARRSWCSPRCSTPRAWSPSACATSRLRSSAQVPPDWPARTSCSPTASATWSYAIAAAPSTPALSTSTLTERRSPSAPTNADCEASRTRCWSAPTS
jgi:hypothetical protein